jgi:tRNA (cmo5U34)-methyltransferase
MAEANNRDDIYAQKKEGVPDFIFDNKVAQVFEDMIQRSVPGYPLMIETIALLAKRYAQNNSSIYDLGCSLGAASFVIRETVDVENCRIVAVDKSDAMLKRCQENLNSQDQQYPSVEFICDDVLNVDINQASVVVLNLTLQFIPLAQRDSFLKKVYDGMLDQSVLILSEKLDFVDSSENRFHTQMHHDFKGAKGYSNIEISQKRTALENVLLPERLATHQKRLKDVGFEEVYVWFQCLNFMSLVAIK